ncbi:MAG TPA: DUF1326 domain-containing protein [Acidimicrobiales bacterium]
MSYELAGHMTEICTCEAICPCFAAQDPDGGSCTFNWVFQVDRGTVEHHDVSGLRLGFLGSFDGNPLEAQVRLAIFVDDRATDAQQAALLRAFTGELGGPLKDLAGLVGEVVAVERAPIEVDMHEGTGHFRIGDIASGEAGGFASPDGAPMVMADMPLSPVLGSPGYPGRPVAHRVDAPGHGFRFSGNSSIQTRFHYVAG